MGDLVGKTLGKYRILSRLGWGGMADVYKAYDPGLKRHVAIKTLRGDRAGETDFIGRFEREAAAVARLRHHHIVRIYDFDSQDGIHYMVMELIDGPTLEDRLEEGDGSQRKATAQPTGAVEQQIQADSRRLHQILDDRFDEQELRNLCFYLDVDYEDLPAIGQTSKARELLQYLKRHGRLPKLIEIGKEMRPEIGWDGVLEKGEAHLAFNQMFGAFSLFEIAHMFTALAGAIDYAHSHGIIHRDLKPANIMFTADGQVVLTDFGIAFIMGSQRQTRTGIVAGTLAYMSPEQCEGERGDSRSDVYALGIILYEVMAGRLPFEADTPYGFIIQHVGEPAPLPTATNPDIPKTVEQVILKTLEKEPNDRYQTAGDMARALRQAIGIRTGQLPPLPPTPDHGDTVEPLPLRMARVPFQAPHDVPRFVGREQLLAEISGELSQAGENNFFCLTGMGGIGKTALAKRLAHLLRDHFSDGVLWANMASSEPLAILDSWAKAFGFDFSGVPDLTNRAAALRGELADKNVLMILDDVRGADQARPLLPAGSRCAVLLTTRDLDLPVVLNAREYHVGVLAAEESRQLLAYGVGDGRVRQEEAYAGEICDLLGHLPLAVEIAARRLASRRRWRLADLAERLHDEKYRLGALKISDQEVRASFTVSWETLDEEMRHFFALLAIFEGRPFRLSALAAVAEMDRRAAEDRLYELVRLSLAAEYGEVHYRQHPLLADFAREHLGEDTAVYAHMAQYYLTYARQYRDNYAILEQEWDNLLAGMRVARRQELWQTIIDYTEALNAAWFARGRFYDARQGYEWACEAAQALTDIPAQAHSLFQWGQACLEQGDYVEASDHLNQSLRLYEELNDLAGVSGVQYELAEIAMVQTDFPRARQLLTESLTIREEKLNDMLGVAAVLYKLADIEYTQGNNQKAKQLGVRALNLRQDADDKPGSIQALRLLADIAITLGEYHEVEKHCQHALALCDEAQDKRGLALTLYSLCILHLRQGNVKEAQQRGERSLELLRSMGDRRSQAQVLWYLSQIDEANQAYEPALEKGQQSLDLCQELGDLWGKVILMFHVGKLHLHLNRPRKARQMWQESLQIASEQKHPLVDKLQNRLKRLDGKERWDAFAGE